MLWSRTSSTDSLISSTFKRLELLARPLSLEPGLKEDVEVVWATGSMLIEGGDGRAGLLLLVIVDAIA